MEAGGEEALPRFGSSVGTRRSSNQRRSQRSRRKLTTSLNGEAQRRDREAKDPVVEYHECANQADIRQADIQLLSPCSVPSPLPHRRYYLHTDVFVSFPSSRGMNPSSFDNSTVNDGLGVVSVKPATALGQ